MKIVRLSKSSKYDQKQLGGKGYNLQKLISWGLNVPVTFVIPTDESVNLTKDMIRLDLTSQLKHVSIPANFAVRSSGVGEDGSDNSFAGIFDTILDVKIDEIADAVQKVYSSRETSVTSMYKDARGVDVIDMAVIIQEMIDADYAGVAFSVNPIEIDRRIGLIEIVKGVGESLVSGKTKPTSVRINKLTGMSRILQTGTDNIPDKVLDKLISMVSEVLWKVDELYDSPIDIEWAYKDDDLYLLQARPITTLGEIK